MPILVIDADMDYISRAWCVAEAAGVYCSGFNPIAVSLDLQVFRYQKVFFDERSFWSLSREEHGFSAGVAKLLKWTLTADINPITDITTTEKRAKQQISCGVALGKKMISLLFPIKNMQNHSQKNLLLLAKENDLHCTFIEDVPLCMDLILRAVTKDFSSESP